MKQRQEVRSTAAVPKSTETAGPDPEKTDDPSRQSSNRIFFAAMTAGFNIRICEQLADESLRCILWNKLTKTDRRLGQRFIQQLAPDSKTLACAGSCAWKEPNRPKTKEDAKALAEFVAAMELRHGEQIWTR